MSRDPTKSLCGSDLSAGAVCSLALFINNVQAFILTCVLKSVFVSQWRNYVECRSALIDSRRKCFVVVCCSCVEIS